MNYFKTLTAAALACLMLTTGGCNDGEVIEEIGNYTITTEAFLREYSTSVEMATRVANAEKSTLYKLICNPSIAPSPEAQDMALRLQPKNSYQQFRDSKIVELVAREEGFMDRPVVKDIIDQMVRSSLVQLYLTEKIWEKIKISEQQKEAMCNELRQREPQRMGPLSLDDCLKVAEGVLKRREYQRRIPEVIEEIKEKISVRKNEDFDKDSFLENDIKLFNSIQEEGGCAADGAVEATPAPGPNGL